MQFLKINNENKKVISSIITLEMSAVGRAIFTCQSEKIPSGFVCYSIDSYIVFLGYVERVQKFANAIYKVYARELSAIFEKNAPMCFRNSTLKNITDSLVEQFNLPIVTQSTASWQTIKIPHFFSIGSGFLVLDNVVKEAQFIAPIYNLLSNSTFFLGDYQNSPFDKELTLTENLFSDLSSVMATLPLVPTLKPGHRLSIAGGTSLFIEKIEYLDAQMRLYFSHNPWAQL